MKRPVQKNPQLNIDRLATRNGKIVEAKLLFNDSDVNVKPIRISTRDQVRWTSKKNDFRILFKSGVSPFKAKVFAVTKGNSCTTGQPIKDARGRYTYAVIFLTDQGLKATDGVLEVTD